ncbi:unnamed protein product [Coffea canephora]|uniref:ADP-ribosylation factor GTPase-activating protein AGD4-like n=2 Tax=Coffea TaxID=13442 RepID=A0A068URG1_COFCA|nr:ADP-ribosylation factor GTPase-activating protein AGD4-like isoform X1 [Coffea arabica]CDP11026.1 unnamed protein product [Coffea canephora]
MATFIKLEDSPMFKKQVRSLEQTSEELKDRCQKLYNGCAKYMETLGEACNADVVFAESLEAFGGGQDDPVSVSIGGPIMSKFISAFRELATYKELLRTQVEHVLVDRLTHFLSVDLQDAKESRRRFDKDVTRYDQARERFASLKKSTRDEIVAELEEDLHNSKSTFERSRFNLVNALMNIEAKKKYEFLESFSAIMDAHLRYFKLGYELLSQMEPFIHQVLAYAQQSKEQANVEQDRLAKRIQEFRTQEQLDHMRASSNMETSTSSIGTSGFTVNSYKNIEAIMQATSKGEVRTIKQGYLLKRSSSLRADWKRRFFVLDSLGNLYYYREKGTKSSGSQSLNPTSSSEHGTRVFGRFRARHQRGSSLNEETLGSRTVDLHTSIIKMDAEDAELRLCFRIISPLKTYTLQAENEADRIDWMDKITGVIASLLNSHLQQLDSGKNVDRNNGSVGASSALSLLGNSENPSDDMRSNRAYSVSKILREIPGNDHCAECRAPDPEWASLNLGILMCIECSGIHRNLGVHISKVRSINLDVKVWEPTVLDLFQALGNTYCNSIWEELLLPQNDGSQGSNSFPSISKPSNKDVTHQKEKFIQAKYVEKLFLNKEATTSSNHSLATRVWEAVLDNNLQEVYRLIVVSNANIINSTYDEVAGANLYHNVQRGDPEQGSSNFEEKNYHPVDCLKSSSEAGNCLQGSSLLHLACHTGNAVMLELLLQFGADINWCDFHGRTPLQYCIARGNSHLAKLLLRRGARASIRDAGGLSALERAMEMGAITDEELFVLLSESD